MRRDPKNGKMILSQAHSLAEVFAALDKAGVPSDFLTPSDRGQRPPQKRSKLVPSSALPQQERAMLSSPKRPQKALRKKRPNRAIEAILEMAEDQHRSGLMADDAYKQIILRHSGPQDPGAAKPRSGGVKGVRIRKKL